MPTEEKKEGLILELPKTEKENEPDEMTKDQVGVGVDEKGFWHFVCHEEKGVHQLLGFLEMSKDAVKAHYIGKMRAEHAKKESGKLLRPSNVSAFVDKVKGKFRS